MSADRISTNLTAAGVDVHGLPFDCCDEWPECTHMYYAVQAVQAHTKRIQNGIGAILDRHEDTPLDHGITLVNKATGVERCTECGAALGSVRGART